MLRAVYRRLEQLPANHPLIRGGRYLRRNQLLRRVTDRLREGPAAGVTAAAAIIPDEAAIAPMPLPGRIHASALDSKAFFAELLRCAADTKPAFEPVPRRVLLVNAGLAAGGAERQIVNTLLGLRCQRLESVSFLGEYLFESAERGFFLRELESSGIAVGQVTRHRDGSAAGINPELAQLLGELPVHFVGEIFDLVTELRHHRPEVLHAWQDSTSIKSGIAAVIVGVPRIVLSSRNVNPSNFAYHQPYMRPAYQALAERQEIVLTNNSEAGAADFCSWLKLPRERYRVVRNGVALDDLKPDVSGARALRERENIPRDALVVGSIFRFWPEKRPLLWLEIAARLLEARPQTHFLLAGDGPLRAQMADFLTDLPHADNIHLIAPTNAVGRVLSAMNAFLLTSRFEGTPNVVLEAEWLGLPVVAMEAGGVAEAVHPGKTGIVCTDDSPMTAVSYLCEMIDDPRWRERAREIGPRFVSERFGLDRMIVETMALYGYTDSSADGDKHREPLSA